MRSRTDINTKKMGSRSRNRRASSIPSGAIGSSGKAGVSVNI